MSEPRPDPDSEMGGETEYGNDTGFAAQATADPTGGTGGETRDGGSTGDGGGLGGDDTAGLTAEDDEPDGDVADVAAATGSDDGPGDGAD